ncbi:HNH endonuclease [[Ruminococcus] torques]|uniref:HNH endonuclease n=1 Tax=[Ruminococcus] torques TaxID=33039 RepID=UPI00399AACAB
MAKEFARSFYSSQKWKKCREAYIAKRRAIDGGLCETCRERPGYIVHHKIELTPENINDVNITLGINNLKYDCHICHQKEGAKDGEAERLIRYEFDKDGDLRELPHKFIIFKNRLTTVGETSNTQEISREGV